VERLSHAGEQPSHKVNVLGVYVDAINLIDGVAQVMRWTAERKKTYVCVTGVHGIMESQRDPDLKRVHNSAGLVTPDGMPLVYINRAAGHPDCGRVYGPDLMLAICRASLTYGYRHFFFGATANTLDRLTARLRAIYPEIQIAGTYAPPFRPLPELESAEVLARINESAPDVVWIGLSTPKQERWMADCRPYLEAPVLIGVGAAFDFHAGTVRQAPAWLQPLCLEWLFRLLTEPRRLWKRYLVNNPSFIISLTLQMLGLKKY
jgi:N-acetylglucosaminyldiphosphoundecaprenol N-acetyl-beta-D-mannosaminyltransferase